MDGSDGWMAMKGTDSSVEKSLEYREIWRGKDENHEMCCISYILFT